MDFFDSEENMDPTLPLNEASSLPPHQAPQDSQWNIYRSTAGSGSGTPIFEGNLVERKNVRGLLTNQSLVASVIEASKRGGYTIKDLEEELEKLRHENFNLKLRIHLLEEHQGLIGERPGETENVIRINLDLRVEKESLKNEIEEKNKLLEDAYIALDILEKERDNARQLYEDQNLKLKSSHEIRTPRRESITRNELLLEAFGSMNLEVNPEDDSELHVKLQHLEGNLVASKDECKKLEEEKANLCESLDKALLEIKFCNEQIGALTSSLEKNRLDAENELSTVKMTLKEVVEESNQSKFSISEKESEIRKLKETIKELEDYVSQTEKSHKNATSEVIETIAANREESEILKSKIVLINHDLELFQDENASLKLEVEKSRDQQQQLKLKADQLQSIVQELEAEVLSKNLELEKTRACVAGLAEINMELKDQISKLEDGINVRAQALEKLKEEYAKAKAIVRRYRSEKQSLENKENISNNTKERNIDTEKYKVSELPLQQELALQLPRSVNFENQKDLIEVVKNEVSKMKKTYVQKGAEKALKKAEFIFSMEVKKLEEIHYNIIRPMQRRLGDLSSFLLTLYSEGNLNISMLTDHEKDSFFKSLKSSRRLSMAYNPNLTTSFGNSSILSNALDSTDIYEQDEFDEELIEFQVPSIAIKLTDKDLELEDEVIEDVQANVENDALTIVNEIQEKLELQKRVATLEKLLESAEQDKLTLDNYVLEKQQFQERELKFQELNDDLKRSEMELSRFKSKYAEASSTVDDLRIQLGQVKDKYRQKLQQVGVLEEKIRLKSESSNEVKKLKIDISKMEAKIADYRTQVKKLESDMSLAKTDHSNEVEKLRQELKEALEKIKVFQERQERIDRGVIEQLAKTHKVMKNTKAMIDNYNRRQ